MRELSVAQEYMLCSLNHKGAFPALNMNAPVCLVAGGLIELLLSGCAEIDEKDAVRAASPLDGEHAHLRSLFARLEQAGPMKIEEIVEDYSFSFTGRRLDELTEDVGRSLVERGCAVFRKGGLLGNRSLYVPEPAAVDRVIQKIRAELLESGAVSDETTALAGLLDKSGQITRYFSDYESRQLKLRLKEIRQAPSGKIAGRMVDYVDTMVAVFAAIATTN